MPKSNTTMISKTPIEISTKDTRNPHARETLTHYLFKTFNYIFNVDASENPRGQKQTKSRFCY